MAFWSPWRKSASPWGSAASRADSRTLRAPVAVGEVNYPKFVCDADILGNTVLYRVLWSGVTGREERSMETSTAALAVLLVAVLCYQVSSSPGAVNFARSCCHQYVTDEVPLHRVVTYGVAGPSQDGVLTGLGRFITDQGKKVCGRPGDKWVQDILKHHNNAGSG
ncbi:C-C motif chemokine 4 homolog [Lathamus discolor]|uniref:C-C motif chemokine 4 homolog n=1 Tax=Lathamus discolor TaxID=678569 RepID=UPI0032B7EAE3